jgi:2-iminobutanoate/2-iminopropanoate deaminase
MVRQVVTTPHPAKFHYSVGIKTEQFVFTSGVAGHVNPDTGTEIKGMEAQTRQCLDTIKEILETAGSSLSKVVNATLYIKNSDDFIKMDDTYKTYFPKDPPTRTTIVCDLVLPQMLVEIQCIAVV